MQWNTKGIKHGYMDKDQISVSDDHQKIMKSNQNGLLYIVMLNCGLVQGTKY